MFIVGQASSQPRQPKSTQNDVTNLESRLASLLLSYVPAVCAWSRLAIRAPRPRSPTELAIRGPLVELQAWVVELVSHAKAAEEGKRRGAVEAAHLGNVAAFYGLPTGPYLGMSTMSRC